jgi:hypothetical protein
MAPFCPFVTMNSRPESLTSSVSAFSIGPRVCDDVDANEAAPSIVVTNIGHVEPILMHRDSLDVEWLGTKVEATLDRPVEPDAVRDAAVARVVDRPIDVAGWVDGEPGGFGNTGVLDGEGDGVLGPGHRRNDREEYDRQQQQPEAARRAHQCQSCFHAKRRLIFEKPDPGLCQCAVHSTFREARLSCDTGSVEA